MMYSNVVVVMTYSNVVVLAVVVGSEMTELADKLNFEREVIRVWFCNKRQTLKNTIKRLKSPSHDSPTLLL